jgi:hypothetical protein
MIQKSSAQPSLFDPPAAAKPERAPPNLDFIRKHLAARLRTVRVASYLPWPESDMKHWEKFFPELARLLPPEEGEALIAEFERHVARLRAVVDK